MGKVSGERVPGRSCPAVIPPHTHKDNRHLSSELYQALRRKDRSQMFPLPAH